MKRPYTMPFGAGDKVVLKVDPRHIGRVNYAHGRAVRVQWEDTGWISEHNADELIYPHVTFVHSEGSLT